MSACAPRRRRAFAVLGLIEGQLPWWVTGPGVGLCVVALYGLINARLGVSGAWLATIAPVEGWRPEPWRRDLPARPRRRLRSSRRCSARRWWCTATAGCRRCCRRSRSSRCCCWSAWPSGYGSRWAGGCTSGHGMSGCAAGSPDSFATTVTFFSVAVAGDPGAATRSPAARCEPRVPLVGARRRARLRVPAHGQRAGRLRHDPRRPAAGEPLHLPDDGQRDGRGVRRSRRPPPARPDPVRRAAVAAAPPDRAPARLRRRGLRARASASAPPAPA